MLPTDADPRLARFLTYWTTIAGDRPLPGRADLDPIDVPDLLPFIFLVEVLPGSPVDFAYRLIGSDIVANTARSHVGRRLSEIVHEGTQGRLIELYRETLESRTPRFRRLDYQSDLGPSSQYDTLVAPLGCQHVTHLAGLAIHRLSGGPGASLGAKRNPATHRVGRGFN